MSNNRQIATHKKSSGILILLNLGFFNRYFGFNFMEKFTKASDVAFFESRENLILTTQKFSIHSCLGPDFFSIVSILSQKIQSIRFVSY